MLTKVPDGLEEIIDTYGSLSDPDFEQRIVSIKLPYTLLYAGSAVTRTRCHHLAADNFLAALEDIASRGLMSQCRHYGGIYNQRVKRGGNRPSTHCWGIAIDLEPDRYPLGSSERFSDEIIEIWKKCGFLYGGDFDGRKDPMHFQLASGY